MVSYHFELGYFYDPVGFIYINGWDVGALSVTRVVCPRGCYYVGTLPGSLKCVGFVVHEGSLLYIYERRCVRLVVVQIHQWSFGGDQI